ncbi:MAG TPA: SH3 domain-containing protein [Candidatus Binatia bacterium]|nr:SH3 domain-containing protein [Candidatus Binatia bacterium]
MIRLSHYASVWLFVVSLVLNAAACKEKQQPAKLKDLPDINEQIRTYTTTENTKVRTGPGPQFRAIADIGRNSKVSVVGRDGEWVLIVSRKGNAPGYIEMASVRLWQGDDIKDTPSPSIDGKYEAVTDTQVRGGPGLHYPVVANITKGTKLNVVEEEKGWLKVESKRGNQPGYVEASMARAVAGK